MKRLLRRVGWTLLGLLGAIIALPVIYLAWPLFVFIGPTAAGIVGLFILSHIIMPAP